MLAAWCKAVQAAHCMALNAVLVVCIGEDPYRHAVCACVDCRVAGQTESSPGSVFAVTACFMGRGSGSGIGSDGFLMAVAGGGGVQRVTCTFGGGCKCVTCILGTHSRHTSMASPWAVAYPPLGQLPEALLAQPVLPLQHEHMQHECRQHECLQLTAAAV
jgi:hypothetical protein